MSAAAAPVPATPHPPPQEVAPLDVDLFGRHHGAEAPHPPPQEGALDGPPACEFTTTKWQGIGDLTPLLLRAGGPAFVIVNGGAGRLSIPSGPRRDAMLEVEDGGLVVRGHMDVAAIDLRATRPLVMNGFAVPTLLATLAWLDAKPGEMTLLHPTPAGVEVLDPPLRVAGRCTDVDLDGPNFDAEAAIGAPAAPGALRSMMLPLNRRVALSVVPKAAPGAYLKAQEEGSLVDVLDERKGWTRILWRVDTLLVFGWVKTAELQAPQEGIGYGTGRGRMGAHDPQWPLVGKLVCSDDVPLWATAQGERAQVGRVRKGTVIEVLVRSTTEALVWVRTRSIHTVPGAALGVRASDLDTCR